MKLIIEIPEEVYKTIMNTSFVRDVDLTFKQSAKDIEQTNAIFSLIDALDNGTPIPDNATFGDVIEKITNRKPLEDNKDAENIIISTKLWNAPYQKGGKE